MGEYVCGPSSHMRRSRQGERHTARSVAGSFMSTCERMGARIHREVWKIAATREGSDQVRASVIDCAWPFGATRLNQVATFDSLVRTVMSVAQFLTTAALLFDSVPTVCTRVARKPCQEGVRVGFKACRRCMYTSRNDPSVI